MKQLTLFGLYQMERESRFQKGIFYQKKKTLKTIGNDDL